MTAGPDVTLTGALRPVQARLRAQAWAARARHATATAAGTALLGALLHLIVPELTAPVALGAAVLTGGARLAWPGAPRPDLLSAARTVDRRAGLDGLLVTALSAPLPDPHAAPHADPFGGDPAGWGVALRARLDTQAAQATRQLDLPALLPGPGLRVWASPLLGVALGVAAWHLPPLPAAPVARVIASPTPPNPDLPSPDLPSPAPTSAQPTSPPSASSPPPGAPDAPAGTISDRPGAGRGAGQDAPLPEARQDVTPAAPTPDATGTPRAGGGTQDTPFGSRENGQFTNQSVTNPDRLAAAPYDPTTAPGAAAQQQKADPGSSGLRAASGGRGIESDGADRCVQGCLTNNDMNRGAAPDPARPRNPQGQTASGTSDSGSAGTAGSSSGTGLGRGTLVPLTTRVQGELGGAAGAGGRVQVLAAPDPATTGAASTATTSFTAAAGAWPTVPETPPPGLPTSSAPIPRGAQAAVRAYFDRSAP